MKKGITMAIRGCRRISLALVSLIFMSSNSVSGSRPNYNFIKMHCSNTEHPAFCVHTLSFYAGRIGHSQRRLVEAALELSLDRTKSAKSFVSILARFRGLKRDEYMAISDCIELMGTAADELRESVKLVKRPGKGREFRSRMAQVNSDLSAALTDGDTCVDGFVEMGLDGKIKDSVTARLAFVALFTSNALDLAYDFPSKHN